MPFVKVTNRQKNDMLRSGGYRERDIVSKARFTVKGNKGRTVTFYKPIKFYSCIESCMAGEIGTSVTGKRSFYYKC